jgi:large subunit ribosomal protein L7/L12
VDFVEGVAVQDRLEKLKQQKAKIDRQIALAMAAERKSQKREDDRVKVLVGAMLLDQIKRQGGQGGETLLARMGEFLARPNERGAVLGEDGSGSAAFRRLTGGEQ